MIKSHLLYQLSYVPERMKNIRNKGVPVNDGDTKKRAQKARFFEVFGHERSRTFDLCLRRAALYPAELRDRIGQSPG